MPRRTHTANFAEIILGSSLKRFVRNRRDRGKSWRLIARDLWQATDGKVDLSHEILRRWYPDPVVITDDEDEPKDEEAA